MTQKFEAEMFLLSLGPARILSRLEREENCPSRITPASAELWVAVYTRRADFDFFARFAASCIW